MALSFVVQKMVAQKIQLRYLLEEIDDERRRERNDDRHKVHILYFILFLTI